MLVAHYYTNPDLQALAEATGGYVSDSLDMARFGHEHPAQTLVVTDSEVRQVTNNPAIAGAVVGNGVYTSGGWIASLGVRGTFGPSPAP